MPKGVFPRKPKDRTTSDILRESQELRAKCQSLVHTNADLKLKLAECELTIANLKYELVKRENQNKTES